MRVEFLDVMRVVMMLAAAPAIVPKSPQSAGSIFVPVSLNGSAYPTRWLSAKQVARETQKTPQRGLFHARDFVAYQCLPACSGKY